MSGLCPAVEIACPEGRSVLREKLAEIGEGLHLDGIARRVAEEHRRLLARQPRKADLWLHSEANAITTNTLRQGFPVVHVKNNAEMRDRHVMTVHGPGSAFTPTATGLRNQMRNDLMPIKIEIDSGFRTPPLCTPENSSVKGPGGCKIVDRKC